VKVYSFIRNENHECTLYVIESGERRRAVPMVISSDQAVRSPILTAVTAMLLDYFSNEDGAEAKAACLARLVMNRLATRWQGWTLTEAELGSMVAEIMVTSYESVNIDAGNLVIEYIGGQRRDLLRKMLTGGGVC
jgi:hypothetical protein